MSSEPALTNNANVLRDFDDAPTITPARRRALWTIALGEFVDGFDLVVIGAALLLIQPQMQLSAFQVGLMAASTFFGSAVGALFFGDLTDRFGRRGIFVLTLFGFVGLGIASALAPNYTVLLIIRALMGVAIGADVAASISFLTELSPRASRGGWAGAIPQLAWTCGALAAVLSGAAFLAWGDASAWRWMLALGTIPALIVLLMRRNLPESPRWLLVKGRAEEAAKALEAFGLKNIDLKSLMQQHVQPEKSSYLDIFRKPYTAPALLAMACVSLTMYAGGASSVLGSYILKDILQVSSVTAVLAGALIWIGGIIGSILAWFFLDRIGRLRSMTFYLVGLFLTYLAMVTVAWNTVWLVPLYLVQGIFTWYGAAANWILPAELLPTRLRGRALGLGHGMARMHIGFTTILVPVMLAGIGFQPMVLILGGSGLLIAAYAWWGRKYEPNAVSLESVGPEQDTQSSS